MRCGTRVSGAARGRDRIEGGSDAQAEASDTREQLWSRSVLEHRRPARREMNAYFDTNRMSLPTQRMAHAEWMRSTRRRVWITPMTAEDLAPLVDVDYLRESRERIVEGLAREKNSRIVFCGADSWTTDPGSPPTRGFRGGSGPPASSKRECRKASGVRGRPLPGAGAACPGPHRRTDLAGVSAPARKLSPAFGRGPHNRRVGSAGSDRTRKDAPPGGSGPPASLAARAESR